MSMSIAIWNVCAAFWSVIPLQLILENLNVSSDFGAICPPIESSFWWVQRWVWVRRKFLMWLGIIWIGGDGVWLRFEILVTALVVIVGLLSLSFKLAWLLVFRLESVMKFFCRAVSFSTRFLIWLGITDVGMFGFIVFVETPFLLFSIGLEVFGGRYGRFSVIPW